MTISPANLKVLTPGWASPLAAASTLDKEEVPVGVAGVGVAAFGVVGAEPGLGVVVFWGVGVAFVVGTGLGVGVEGVEPPNIASQRASASDWTFFFSTLMVSPRQTKDTLFLF